MHNTPTIRIKKPELAYIFLGILTLAFIFFGNGIGGKFVYDDNWVIGLNPTISQISQIPQQFISPYQYNQPGAGLYRPLTIVSYTLNFLFGKGPASFHVVNILLYACNTFLVFLLVLKLFSSKRLAYLTSLLFFFLPIHVEAVTFISGRADLLALFFALVALLLFLSDKHWLGSVAFLLSLFSKESTVLFVPLVFAFWLWVYKKENITGIVKKAIYFVPPAIIYGLLRYAAIQGRIFGFGVGYVFNPLASAGLSSRLYTALKVMLLEFWKTFFPFHLSADYSFNQITLIHSVTNLYVITGLLVLVSAILVVFWKKTRTTSIALGAVMFLSSYFVVSNFVFIIGTIMAERTFYLPSLGTVLTLGFLIDKLMSWKFKKLWWAIFILVCVFYGLVIIHRNAVWRTEQSLFENTVLQSPNSVHANEMLAITYLKNNKWDEGKKLLEKGYHIYPHSLTDLDGLGIVAEYEGRYKDAENFYSQVLQINPHYAPTLSNLSRMYFQLGMYKKAADLIWQRFNFRSYPNALLLYAMSQSMLGKYDEAISEIKKYYGDNPADINFKFVLGYAYYKKGNKATADIYFKQSKNPALSDEEFIKSIENFKPQLQPL